MDVKELGRRIKNYRVSRGLTQAELAEKLLLAPQTVSKWERGLSAPDIVYLSTLCAALGITPSKMLQENTTHNSKYMIAIDGGGTKTEFVLFTSDGRIADRISKEGTNPNFYGIRAVTKTLKEGIDKLLSEQAEVERIYAGIAGTSSGDNKKRILEFLNNQYPAYKISIESDIMNVIGLAENNQKCTAAIMGTGSVAFGWDGKELHRMGGWGYLFDESGSGYSIGRDIISLALAAEDGLQEKSEAVHLVEAKLDGKPFDFIDVLYSKGTDYIASFAPLAFTAMEAGDKNAEKIIRKAASHVAGLIRETIKKYDVGNSVIISGSVAMNQPSIQKMLSDELNGNISLEIADFPPIFGAMRRCLDLSKIEYDFKSIKQNFVL